MSKSAETTQGQGFLEYKSDAEARTQVLNTLFNAVTLMQYIDPQTRQITRGLSPLETLTIENIQDSIKKIDFRHGESTFKREWTDPSTDQPYTDEEGVPVDDLLLWLHRQNGDLELSTEDEVQARLERSQIISMIEEHSLPFIALVNDEEAFDARVRLEASFVSQDIRNTGSETENLAIAKQAMLTRREFYPPHDGILQADRKRQEMRDVIMTRNTEDIEDPTPDTHKKSRTFSKESLAATALTAFPATVLIDNFHHDSIIKAATASTALFLSTAANYYSQRKQDSNEGSLDLPEANPLDEIKQFVKLGTLPVAANVVGPDVALQLLDHIPTDYLYSVKTVALYVFLKNIPRATKIVRGPVKGFVKNFLESSVESTYPEYEPFELDETNDPLTQGHDVVHDAVDFMLSIHPIAQILPDKIQKHLPINKDVLKDTDDTFTKLLRSSFFDSEDEASLAFVRYDALFSFVQFLNDHLHDPESRKSMPLIPHAEKAALDTMHVLDSLALSTITDPKDELRLNPEEDTQFELYKNEQLGLAYLLSLASQKPQIHDVIDEHTEAIYMNATHLPITDKKIHELSQKLRYTSFKDTLETRAHKTFGKTAEGGVHVLFKAGEKVNKYKNRRKKTK